MYVWRHTALGPLGSGGNRDPASVDGWDLSGRGDHQAIIMAIRRDEQDKSGER